MNKLARFIWPVMLAVLGVAFEVVAVVTLIRSFPDMRHAEMPVLAPGESTVTITKPGDCTLWYESKTVIDGQYMTFPDQLPAGVTITIIKQPEGTRVPLRASRCYSADTGNSRSVAIGDLTFTSPGQYQVVVTGLTDKRAFDLSQPMNLHGIPKAFVIGLIGGLCFLAAFVSAIYAIVRLFGHKA
jgi:hypothetical protein